MKILTKLDSISSKDPILKGDELWLINGTYPIPITKIMQACKGLNRYWNCLEKAQIVQTILGKGDVIVGDLKVVSGDFKSEYGFDFNPPYEFHSWLEVEGAIIDIALPGVIEKGLTTHDEYGPYLVGREPVILAGKPESWMKYISYERVN